MLKIKALPTFANISTINKNPCKGFGEFYLFEFSKPLEEWPSLESYLPSWKVTWNPTHQGKDENSRWVQFAREQRLWRQPVRGNCLGSSRGVAREARRETRPEAGSERSWRGSERRLAIGRSQQRNTAWGPNPSASLEIQTSIQRYLYYA